MLKNVEEKRVHIIQTIIRWYQKKILIKITITMGLFVSIMLLIWLIPAIRIKKSSLQKRTVKELSAEMGEIAADAGEVLVAETGSKKLYFDTVSMNLRVVDYKAKQEWNALAKGAKEPSDLSLLSVSYLGKDNNLYEWDSYHYCTELKAFSSYQIQNGVRIKMHLSEGESTRFYEYLPQKMPFQRFEEFFIQGLEDKKADGTIDETNYEKYKQTLNLIYRKSVSEECYVVAYVGNPPASAVAQLIEITKLLGYTKEMLEADSSEFGITVTYQEPVSFDITLEATLEGDDFLVRVPTTEMVSDNDFYVIQNIKVLPNFGAVSAEEWEEGSLFVPDGAGALIDFNTYNPAVPDYIRPVYDNDYYKDYFYKPEYGEELMMPVFGTIYGKEKTAKGGFLAIIEQGAETSYIHTKVASKGEAAGSAYNKIFASFDMTQYNKVKVEGPYSNEGATYLVNTEVMPIDYTLRYQLMAGKISYFDLAKKYQEYLLSNHSDLSLTYSEKAKVYLDVIGAVTRKKRIVGVPYDSVYSMTTYNELANIITELKGMSLMVTYSGGFNEGMNNTLMNKVELVPANGAASSLKSLLTTAAENQVELYLNAPISQIYKKGKGFIARWHGIRNYSNDVAEIYRYTNSLGVIEGLMRDEAISYYILSPRYLKSVISGFLKETKNYNAIYIPDLANYCYSDYRDNNMIDAYSAAETVREAFERLSKEKKLALYNPKMSYINYGDLSVDISRESSNYANFSTTIPFRQLVMNGLAEYTTTNVNMSSKNPKYYLLQAVELGSIPKFTLSAKNVDVLKNTGYSYLYSTEYSLWKNTITELYEKYEEAMKIIKSKEIIDHKILADNIFMTEYKNHVRVISNYNLTSVTINGEITNRDVLNGEITYSETMNKNIINEKAVDGKTIGPLDYIIIKP